MEEVCSGRMRERRRANTWASPALCRPTDSRMLRGCFSPNRSFLSPSRSIADLLSSSALDTLPLWLSPTSPNHPPTVFQRKVCACPASSSNSSSSTVFFFLQKSVTGAGWRQVGNGWDAEELGQEIASLVPCLGLFLRRWVSVSGWLF